MQAFTTQTQELSSSSTADFPTKAAARRKLHNVEVDDYMTGSSKSISRRKLLRVGLDTALLYGAAQAFPAQAANVVSLPFENGERPLVSYPQKRPLIQLTTRPPQLRWILAYGGAV